jgi:hypothetical protein
MKRIVADVLRFCDDAQINLCRTSKYRLGNVKLSCKLILIVNKLKGGDLMSSEIQGTAMLGRALEASTTSAAQ